MFHSLCSYSRSVTGWNLPNLQRPAQSCVESTGGRIEDVQNDAEEDSNNGIDPEERLHAKRSTTSQIFSL